MLDAIVAIEPLRESVQRQDLTRVQDFMLRLPSAGSPQAYLAANPRRVPRLTDINRLTYFREAFLIGHGNPREILADIDIHVDFTPNQDLSSAVGQRVSPAVSLHQLTSQ